MQQPARTTQSAMVSKIWEARSDRKQMPEAGLVQHSNRKHLGQNPVTVMFADMVGYSDRLQRDQARNSAQAAKSIRLFKSLISDYNGKVANVAGDGILALFMNSTDALTFAREVQRTFYEQAVWSDGEPMRFRIGLSQGEIAVKQRNVHGHCVNVAARI